MDYLYRESRLFVLYIILENQSSLCCLEYRYVEIKKEQNYQEQDYCFFILKQNQSQKKLNDMTTGKKKTLPIQNSSLLTVKSP